jgi:enoyl-CoA hydratase
VIDVSHAERVAIVTLSRPEKHNALTTEMCERLSDVMEHLPRRTRAVVIAGSGESFCSGADLEDVYDPDFRVALYPALHAVSDSPLPVIAAINGPAIGAGTQLAIAADFRIVSATARFAVPTARIGLAVDPWTVRRLALVAGHRTARQLLVACTDVDATAALACGLGDRAGTLDDSIRWARAMSELAPLTLAYSKRVLNDSVDRGGLDQREAALAAAFEACWSSDDVVEARRARDEKRPPVFTGA